jgi:hypothetical protein
MSEFAVYPWLTPAVIGVLLVPLWIAIAYLTAYKTGWVNLARHYRTNSLFRGTYIGVGQARFGKGMAGNLNSALLIGANVEGMRLRMIFLFRLSCPDLYVPWSDITVRRGKTWSRDYVEFEFKKNPDLPLRLFSRAAGRIQALAGTAWPERVTFDVVHR